VRPAWRRRGLARALLSRALLALRERGIDVIRLRTVSEFRTRASDLYRSTGFHVLKEFPRYRKSAT
jgi:ribosomal protein S18 acetylase RimI-like enzyme